MADEAEPSKENRFSYLLQPIRDLAANWDINIAGELEEYLDELENLTFTIEGCAGPSLNFAEAALLIQGTTCVFSKKVEYLHNLVYQALETIFNKRSQAKAAAAGGGSGADKAASKAAAAAAAGLELDSPEGFYALLSQPLETAASSEIDLDDDDETAPPELLRPPTALLALEDAACGQGNAAASSNGRGEDTCRLARCTVHISGALLLEARDGEHFDALLRPLLAGSLLRSTAATAAGRVLQQGLGAAAAAAAAAAASAAVAAGQQLGGVEGAVVEGGQQQQQRLGEGEFVCGEQGGQPMGDDDAAGHEGYGGDYDDTLGFAGDDDMTAADADPGMTDAELQQQQQLTTGGDPAAAGADEDLPDWLSREGGAAAVDTAAGADAAAAADGEGGAATARQARRGRGRSDAVAAAAGAGDEGFYDPYTPLDPTAKGTLPIKPLQVRKPKRPARLNCLPDLTTAGATDSSTAAAAAAGGQLAAAAERLNASYHPQLQWPEFGHLLDSLAAAAAAGGRGRRGGRGAAAAAGALAGPVSAAVLDWGDAAAAEAADQALLEQQQQQAGDWDGVGGDWGGAGGDGYENDSDGFGDAAAAAAAAAAAGDAAAGGLSPWAAAALGGEEGGLPAWMSGAGGGGRGGQQQPEALSYEELCRSHIESLIQSAAAAQTQCELAARVSTWRQRIDPILKAEEDRSAFDIHTYGSHILGRLVDLTHHKQDHEQQQQQQQQEEEAAAGGGAVADFVSVAGAGDSFEVCRVFAAMLQLVNNRNINLVKGSTPEGKEEGDQCDSSSSSSRVCNNLQLQLLTVARVHEAMAEGLAGEGAQQEHAADSLAAPPPRAADKPKGAAAAKGGKGGSKKQQPGTSKAGAAAAEGEAPKQKKQKTAGKKGRKAAAAGGSSSSSDEDDGAASSDEGSSGSEGGAAGGAASDSDVENVRPAAQQRQGGGRKAAGGKKAAAAAASGSSPAAAAKQQPPATKRARRAVLS